MKTLNYRSLIQDIIFDLTKQIDEFRHIKPNRIIISSTPCRANGKSGLWASLVPLRFENGHKTKIERRKTFNEKHFITLPCKKIRKLRQQAEDYFLYYLYLAVPRFYNLKRIEKLETLIHELYHVNPVFNGDLRRFPGRCYIHGPSVKAYDEKVNNMRKIYEKKATVTQQLNHLSLRHTDLLKRYDKIDFPHYQEPEQNILKVALRPKKVSDRQLQFEF